MSGEKVGSKAISLSVKPVTSFQQQEMWETWFNIKEKKPPSGASRFVISQCPETVGWLICQSSNRKLTSKKTGKILELRGFSSLRICEFSLF